MNKDFKNQILEKIHNKKVIMYPKIYFVTRTSTIILVSLSAFLLLVFSLSFVFFSIHESGEQFLLGFGMKGILTFIRLFPWAMIIFTVLLLFVLEWLLRHFKFSYRLPILHIFLYTFLITTITSILITITPIHSTFLKKADVNQLPIIGGAYESIHDSRQSEGIFRGNITSIGVDTFIISHNDNDKDADDGTWTVVPPSGFNFEELYMNEKVYIAGEIQGDKIYAFGIHKLPTNKEMK